MMHLTQANLTFVRMQKKARVANGEIVSESESDSDSIVSVLPMMKPCERKHKQFLPGEGDGREEN